MASQLLKQLVPYLLLISIFSISDGKEKPCTCSDSDQVRRSNHTLNETGFTFHLIDKDSRVIRRAGLNFVGNLSDPVVYNSGVLSTMDHWIKLWQNSSDGLGVDEASFSATIVYQPVPNRNNPMTPGAVYGGLTFLTIPEIDILVQANDSSLVEKLLCSDVGSLNLDATQKSVTSATESYSVSVAIGMLRSEYDGDHVVGVNIIIHPTTGVGVSSKYSVWIVYDSVDHSLSVYVDVEGKPKPKTAIAEQSLNMSAFTDPYAYFGIVSTVGQLIGGLDFSGTVDNLPAHDLHDKGGFLSRNRIILFPVLGSVAATVVIAMGMAWYFNSTYRRWQKDLDQLARSMEHLPGVPTKVDYADINKATRNFNEDMKLGRGGFGTVYRCTLSAACCKTDRTMDVAIKRFTRDVQNHRYDDFLAEVSIINRLRHKNIVPLIGWSYNKGVPLLVFEYMTNGSLDQHLFGRSGSGTQEVIHQWATRYEIVRGIATGLHYVHHEYEPMVLHCDIKASNVMLDSSFRARLGDFGLACIVDVDRNSATGIGGTRGYISPEYAMCQKATRQTDIYALGVLILEVVTGQRALADHLAGNDNDHITDRVWRLHREGRLPECVDTTLISASSSDTEEQQNAGGDVERLLLLGLACTNPNPSDRPTMPDVVQVIAKSAPPPEVPPQKPRFVWPPPEAWATDDDSRGTSMMSVIDLSTDEQDVSLGQPMAHGRYASFQVQLQSAPECATATKRHASLQVQNSV